MTTIQQYEQAREHVFKQLKRIAAKLEAHDRKCSATPNGHEAGCDQLAEIMYRLDQINNELLG